MRPHGVLRRLMAAVLLVLAPLGAAADQWPSRPLHIIVPYAPGGATDVLARLLAPGLGERLGKSVIVENRTGANGVIGVEVAARAAPDGYTLLMGTIATHGIQPTLLKDLPYDPQRDFLPLIQVAAQPYVVVVNPTVPAHRLEEFVAAAKQRSESLQYASAGSGTAAHLFAEYWASRVGLDTMPVHYRGAAPALNEVIAGHLPMTFDVLFTTLPQINAGTLRALAVTSRQRSTQLPDVPTIAEQGLPGFEAVGWNGLFLPARTPREIADRLNREIDQVLAQPAVQEPVKSQGAFVVGGSSEAFARFIDDEVAKWAKVIRDQHITPD